MKKKLNIPIITGIYIITIVLVCYYFLEIKSPKQVEIPTKKIVIANQYIPENTVIEKDMVTVEGRNSVDINKEIGICSEIKTVIGKRTLVPIGSHEPIKNFRLIANTARMEDQYKNKKEFGIKLDTDFDKALEFKKGMFIDVWVLPKKDKIYTPLPYKLLEKIEIIKVKDNKYQPIVEKSENKNQNLDKLGTNTYMTILLEDTQIESVLKEISNENKLSCSLYNEAQKYDIKQSIIKTDNKK